ncbi:MAG: diadenylate cyclase CdaA [Acidobacteriota bacterium]
MQELLSQLTSMIGALAPRHVLDILIVSFLIYEVLRLMRGTRAAQMAGGLLAFGLVYQFSIVLKLTTVEFLMRNIAVYLGFGLFVLFQHEIRAALTQIGNNLLLKKQRNKNPFGEEWYDEVVLAATTLSSEKTGALMVFERDVGLKTYIESGIRLDARVNYDLLVTIFNTYTPLHDGALIISNARIAAACCFLPLTQNPRISRELGTRHRAAIGLTEDCDAFAVIVSEETVVISFSIDGHLRRNLDGPSLRRMIQQAMEPWRSEVESLELEKEERQRERELEKLTINRPSEAGVARENRSSDLDGGAP